jgi:hypothetical protein
MTFLDLQNLTAYWLDDLNFGYFTTTQVKVFINNAQRTVQKLLLMAGENFYVKPVQTTMIVDQTDYVLPSDFVWLHRLEVIVSGSGTSEERQPLQPITLNQQDFIPNGRGTPEAYYLKKNRIVVLPAPDSAKTLRLHYSPRVSDMSADADLPDVPEDYHEYIAIVAARDGLIKDRRDMTNIQVKLKDFETVLKQLAEQRKVDVPRQIVTTEMGFGSMF